MQVSYDHRAGKIIIKRIRKGKPVFQYFCKISPEYPLPIPSSTELLKADHWCTITSAFSQSDPPGKKSQTQTRD